MIKLTDNAKKHLTNLKAKHNVDYVRLEVKGGVVLALNMIGHLSLMSLIRHQQKMM